MRHRFTLLIALLVAACIASPSMGVLAMQEIGSAADEDIEQGYVRVYLDLFGSSPDPDAATFIMIVGVMDMVDETAATERMETMVRNQRDESDFVEFSLSDVEDLGDEAVEYGALAGDSDEPQYGTIARDGDVVIFVLIIGTGVDEELSTDIVRFMFEQGPSDQPVVTEANGDALSGGWVEAFPTPEDFPELTGMDGFPVYDLMDESILEDVMGDDEDTKDDLEPDSKGD